jgi:hypothetical protein
MRPEELSGSCEEIAMWTKLILLAVGLSMASLTDRAKVQLSTEQKKLILAIEKAGGDVSVHKGGEGRGVDISVTFRDADTADTHLRLLRGLDDLWFLQIAHTQVTDDGLDALSESKSLELINLIDTKVTGRGLEKLKGLPRLKQIVVGASHFGDTDLRALNGFEHLEMVAIVGTLVTDDGLNALSNLKTLTTISLKETKVNGPGLQYLKELPNLHELMLGGSSITDRTVPYLEKAGLVHLQRVILNDTEITDASVQTLTRFGALKELAIHRSKITPDGVDQLRHAIPNVDIQFTPIPSK